MSSLKNDIQSLFFYHFQKALDVFWQNNCEDIPKDLCNQVFLIEDTENSFSFVLIFSEHQICIVPSQNTFRVANVRIVLDKKELFELIKQKFMQKTKQTSGVAKIKNLQIHGDAKLASQLAQLLEKFNFDLYPFLGLLTPPAFMGFIRQLPIQKVFGFILEQIIGTIENLNKGQNAKP